MRDSTNWRLYVTICRRRNASWPFCLVFVSLQTRLLVAFLQSTRETWKIYLTVMIFALLPLYNCRWSIDLSNKVSLTAAQEKGLRSLWLSDCTCIRIQFCEEKNKRCMAYMREVRNVSSNSHIIWGEVCSNLFFRLVVSCPRVGKTITGPLEIRERARHQAHAHQR